MRGIGSSTMKSGLETQEYDAWSLSIQENYSLLFELEGKNKLEDY